ncbi:MAG: malectin domain-containing carbohydrate-binding protein [Bryobacteraceae bacterium]
MSVTTSIDHERSELDSILASGILDRAPSLAQLLTYVCTKYFEGSAEQIKEYNIAVEALGRPPDFDQKKDSIVRVEAHKLRKRLREYYELQGAGHVVRIEIPPGQYAPRFVSRTPEILPALQQLHAIPRTEAPARRQRALIVFFTLAAASAAIGGTAYIASLRTHSGTPAAADIRGSRQSADDIRILAGVENGAYVDGFGRGWQTDRFFNGGAAVHSSNLAILGTRDPHLYQNRREGAFSYDIPLKPGVYELRLHFAETLYGDGNAVGGGGETSRLFDLCINGRRIFKNFDVIADAGATTADVKVFKDISPASDGKLHLKFDPVTNPAILNAIEITPGIQGRMHSLRAVAQSQAFTDKDGTYWEPDRSAKGGQLVLRRDQQIANTSDPELYSGERFGNITYVIPVAAGRYGVTFHFAETWFGPGNAGGGGAGSRVFDILCNGVALKRDFDIFKEAGGAKRALSWSVHNVEPNHQGKLVISLVPVENYAAINAFEIVDESL